MFSSSIYSWDPTSQASDPKDDVQQMRMGRILLDSMRASPPGMWLGNHLEECNHFTGRVYVFIRCIMDLSQGATFTLQKRKRRNRHRSTFGPGIVKALPTAGQHGQDEEYSAFDDTDFTPVKLLKQPNDTENFSELDSYITLQSKLTGVAPLWHVPNNRGRPVELWALPTALTFPLYQRSPAYPKGAWRVQPFYAAGGLGYLPSPYLGSGAIIPGQELTRMMDPHPYYKWDGLSPQSAGAVQVDILQAIDTARHTFMINAPMIDGVLLVPGADADQLDRLDARFNQKYAGAQNAGRFGSVGIPGGADGKLGFMNFAKSSRDLDFHEGSMEMTQFIGALFGVPLGVACLEESASYSVLYAQIRQFLYRQSSFVKRKASFYTQCIADPWCSFPGEYLVQIDLPTPDDPDILQARLGADTKVISVNEHLRLRGLQPWPEFGEYPVDIATELLKAKVMPQPEPQPAAPGVPALEAGPTAEPGQEEPQPESDPLAALLGDTPTGGAVPGAPNPASEGTGIPQAKSMSAYHDGTGGTLTGCRKTRKRSKLKRGRRVLASIVKAVVGVDAGDEESDLFGKKKEAVCTLTTPRPIR